MGLHLHSAACEAYLTTPPDYDQDDPLRYVDFPRERKPGKRNRHALKDRARWHRNLRCNSHPIDHTVRFDEFGYAASHRYRLRIIGHLFSDYERREEKRYWRCAIFAASRAKPVPLPAIRSAGGDQK